ncbi:hypothetical protein [Neisseria zalophi]|uniref:Uncharacterized protein n=1 Tax=Neisseria zalophi TaxID=640030 RepID=A0A5J6PST7_9NEIS|nr:hypothetical protein [Neisseria zalophi]QEY25808.1 hypothetical protein D0T92_04145 [Neisseria zalophi]
MTKISAAEFIKKHQATGRNSKLEPYKADILLLKSQGYTQQQILDFLRLNGVTVGMTTLNWFIRSRMENIDKKSVQQNPATPSPVSSEKANTTENKQVQVQDQNGEPRKFEFDPSVDAKKLM